MSGVLSFGSVCKALPDYVNQSCLFYLLVYYCLDCL